jgi:hypothetical protein
MISHYSPFEISHAASRGCSHHSFAKWYTINCEMAGFLFPAVGFKGIESRAQDNRGVFHWYLFGSHFDFHYFSLTVLAFAEELKYSNTAVDAGLHSFNNNKNSSFHNSVFRLPIVEKQISKRF